MLIQYPAIVILIVLSLVPAVSSGNDSYANELPTIGNSSSSLISTQEERVLGQAWLRALRRNTQQYYNPFLNEYLNNLIYKLAPQSEVQDKAFTLVVIDSPSLNAFAVPGSIIGINAGLLFYTQSEHELASVIAHELAHLSQRHYARQLEQHKETTPLTLLGMLASAIIAAKAGSEAGIAALASTQALNADSQLRFSRKNEQEADRIGIKTLFESNFDPEAMPRMFERMYQETKTSGNRPPEYLSTHPLSENRISDTKSRSQQFVKRNYSDNVNFYFVRNMIISDYAENKLKAAESFSQYLNSTNKLLSVSSKFGLAYSLINESPKKSIFHLEELLDILPGNIYITLLLSKAYDADNQPKIALERAQSLLNKNPGNYAASYILAKLLFKNDQIKEAEAVLKQLSKRHADDPQIWYLLAEVQGIAGNIADLHQSRAEYFFLTNNLDQAIKQLRLAQNKTNNDLEITKIQTRLEYFYNEKNKPRF